jgi:hypothetical protein
MNFLYFKTLYFLLICYLQSIRPSSFPLGSVGSPLVTATGPTMMPRMTTISTSAYPSLLPLGSVSTTASANTYQQQTALLTALQLHPQSLFSK